MDGILCENALKCNAMLQYPILHSRVPMEPRELLQALMTRAGDNPHSLAAKLKRPPLQSQVHRFLAGTSKEPRRSTLHPVAVHYDIPLDALYDSYQATLVARRLRLDEPGVATLPAEPTTDPGDALLIPQYEAGGAMGHGLVLEEQPPGIIKSWTVDHEWLRLNVRHHTGIQNLCIVTGFGPSMRGMFNPGDPLLCDIGRNTVDVDGVYFFRVGEHGFIKILQRIPMAEGVGIRAKSKNPDYDPFDITPKMLAQEGYFQVFGKVLTVWKSEVL